MPRPYKILAKSRLVDSCRIEGPKDVPGCSAVRNESAAGPPPQILIYLIKNRVYHYGTPGQFIPR